MSNSASVCPDCGAVRRPGTLRGLCPHCMMRVALDETVEEVEEAWPAESIPDGAERFGDYLLVREIGRGGMGVVYEARELSLNRIVALKMLLPSRLRSTAQLERFRLEAEAIATLDHPNLLPVYTSGNIAGQPYFTMKRAEGGSLGARLSSQEQPFPYRETARIISDIARAVHYAHQRGIHHRDLKPANILMDATGRPYVGDFGLAKFMDNDAQLTLSTEIFGSLAYMAPEQAAGNTARVTFSADIYSLGVMLYEMLARRVPFTAESTAMLLRKIAEDEPVPPRSIDPGISVDLEVICLKCLQKEPEKRPSSAEFLADELDRWLRGEPILSRRVSVAERVVRWARRRPALALALVALATVFVTGAGTAGFQWRRATVLSQQRYLERYAADMQVASQALGNHDLGLARRMVAAQIPAPGEDDLRGVEWKLLSRYTRGEDRLTLKGHTATVTAVASFPDGRKIVSGAMDGTLRIWDAQTGVCVATVQAHSPVVWSVAVSPDGQIISAGSDGYVRFWNAAGQPAGPPLSGMNAAISRDGRFLAISASPPFKYHPGSPGLSFWNLRTKEKLFETNLVVRRVAVSTDGALLASATEDGILVLEPKTGVGRRLATETPWTMDFSPDGANLAAAGFNLGATVWKLGATPESRILSGHKYTVWGIAYSPDGLHIATTGSDRTLRIHDAGPGGGQVVMEGHDDEIWGVAWLPGRAALATASKDMSVRVWPDRPKATAADLPSVTYFRPSYSPDGSRLMTSHPDSQGASRVVIRSTASGSVMAEFPGRWEGFFPPSGNEVYLVGPQGARLERWDMETGKLQGEIPLAGAPVQAPATDYIYALDGTTLAGVYSNAVCVWNSSNGAQIGRMLALPGEKYSTGAVSPGGRRVALSAETAYDIALFDLENGTSRRLTNHTELVKGLCFSRDGRYLASASVDRFVRVWDATTGRLLGELLGHLEEASDVAFSPDGRTLASIGISQSVKFWHLPTFREVLSLDIPDAGEKIAFSPRNDGLVFTSLHNTARVVSFGAEGAQVSW